MKKEISAELTDKQADEVLISLRSRLVKWKFTIVDFNLMDKQIRSRRSNLEHVLLGLVRQVNVQIVPEHKLNGKERPTRKSARWVLKYECVGKRALISTAVVGAITPIVLWGTTPVIWGTITPEISPGGIFAIILCAAIGGAANIILGHIFALRFLSWVHEDIKKVQTAST
jgi:hypothetical protein